MTKVGVVITKNQGGGNLIFGQVTFHRARHGVLFDKLVQLSFSHPMYDIARCFQFLIMLERAQ